VSGVYVQWQRLLCLMFMVRASEYPKLGQHFPAQGIARQHTFDRILQYAFGRFFEQLLEGHRPEIADVARVTIVHLVFQFVACHANLFGVDDDNVVARINVRRIFGFVLATQPTRNLARQASQCLAGGINNIPVAANLVWLGRKRLHGVSIQMGGQRRPQWGAVSSLAKGAKFYLTHRRNANRRRICGQNKHGKRFDLSAKYQLVIDTT